MACVGLIGFGAIGRALHAALDADWTVLMRPGSATILPPGMRRVGRIEDLIAANPLVVVEAAGAEAARRYLPALLEAGLAVIPASVGALADPVFHDHMRMLAARTGGRIVLQGGALGGLDYLAAVAPLADARARYTSRKPVAAWRGELAALGVDPDALAAPHVLFAGTAAEAARLYPCRRRRLAGAVPDPRHRARGHLAHCRRPAQEWHCPDGCCVAPASGQNDTSFRTKIFSTDLNSASHHRQEFSPHPPILTV